MMYLSNYLEGFALGLSLILAIGSQNAFVLKQGLKNQYVFIVCLVCAFSDAILISLGVAGFGVIVKQYPQIEIVARYGGAIFLGVYAIWSFKSAFTKNHALIANAKNEISMSKAILICLAFTWLNPHVYLDTVVLLGSVSTQYQPNHWQFACGAMLASFAFFFALGYGARFLSPLFSNPKAWKVLDFVVGFIMTFIAISLII